MSTNQEQTARNTEAINQPEPLILTWLNSYKWSICGVILVPVVIGLLIHRPSWTGFGPGSTKSTERNAAGQVTKTVEIEQSGKTLWDWLSVLGVPLSLALLGVWFQRREQKRANEQAQLEREIATTNQREEALQAYFDRLSTLLIDKNLIAVATKVKRCREYLENPTNEIAELISDLSPLDSGTGGITRYLAEQQELLDAAVDVIRARTLSILRQLGEDGERKGSVIRFLIEAEVISKLNLNLSGANLSGAKLIFANLSFANLSGTDLIGTNLSGTDLSDVREWETGQLNSAKLCKTRLPEGCKLNPDRDC